MRKMRFLIGIDEAGRGPLAGPVTVAAVLIPHDFDWSLLPPVRDSKQLSHKKREEVFARVRALEKSGIVRTAVAFSAASSIDKHGIVRAVSRALARALARLAVEPASCDLLLDGCLYAPVQYRRQRTIIRGDSTVPVISLASIIAKVRRDRRLLRLAEVYPGYGLDVHKGYGTLAHRTAIARRGLTPVHRNSFCTNIRRARVR